MNKKKIFEQMWMDVNKRLPPEIPGEIVLVLCRLESGEYTICNSVLVNYQINQRRKGKELEGRYKRAVYWTKQWMRIY